MGTRSLTFVYNGAPLVANRIICMYQQFDGYPSCVGLALANFLEDRVLVNGIGSGRPEKASNGMACLTASLVAETKDGIGGVYLYPTNTNDAGQDYEYHIYFEGNYYAGDAKLMVRVRRHGKSIFTGDVPAFKAFCEKDD